MSFLAPLFLFLGLLAFPIVLLYMLRLRRREMLVSSTLLWRKLLRDREANAPWQRLRRNLLLLLQLLVLAVLVLALARPFLPVPSIVSGSVVVLLDASASMLATDVEPNRFMVAKEKVTELIGELDGRDQMTLILVGRTPQVLASASGDHNGLRLALEQAQATPASADWPAAFALASGAAQGFQEARIVVVSDGGLPDDLPPMPAEVVYVPIGTSTENLAITALATAETNDGPQLFTGVTNHGQLDQDAVVSVLLNAALFDSRRITVPAGGTQNLTWDLPEDTADITARVTDVDVDHLPLDDVAWTVHESGANRRVLIVGEANRFLETAFTVLPGVDAFRSGLDVNFAGEEADDFEMVIFDSMPAPDPAPAADLLFINPQPSAPDQASRVDSLFSVTGAFTNTNVIRVTESPLLRFVDWGNIHVRQAQTVDAPWAQPLVVAEGGPLLLAGERSGRRIVIITFRLQDSDLPLQIAFPVLVANIMGWLSPGQALESQTGLRPGDLVSIMPNAGATAVIVHKPDGTIWTEAVGEETVIFSQTDQLGLYEVHLRDSSGDQPAGRFAVNLFAPAESAIQPAEAIRFGQQMMQPADEQDVGQRELWPWLAGAAFAVLLVEWWIYHRGARMPQSPTWGAPFRRLGRR